MSHPGGGLPNVYVVVILPQSARTSRDAKTLSMMRMSAVSKAFIEHPLSELLIIGRLYLSHA